MKNGHFYHKIRIFYPYLGIFRKTSNKVYVIYVHSPRKSGSEIKFLSPRHICLVLIFATTNFLSLGITRDKKYQFYVGPGIKMASKWLKMSLTLFADTRLTSE